MSISKSQLRTLISERLPSLAPVQSIEAISGGNLNYVWRIRGKSDSCIVKYTPPYIASQPDVSLDPHRAVIEARALDELGKGRLKSIANRGVGIPELLDFDRDRKILLMEEISSSATLGDRLLNQQTVEQALEQLAKFIARLHSITFGREWAASRFDNLSMQATRREVQYRPVTRQLENYDVSNAASLGARAQDLGDLLMGTGKCMVMGDLWPPSVLMAGDRPWLIDWELAHYGRPLQDVGHLIAHVWLYGKVADRAPTELITLFWEAYRKELGDDFSPLWDEKEFRGMAVHAGAEIITPFIGAFSSDYL
jgi:5-methylthioribose kinase